MPAFDPAATVEQRSMSDTSSSSHPLRRQLARLISALLMTFVSVCSAQTLDTWVVSQVAADTVVVSLGGLWHNGCIPRSAQVTRALTEVEITLSVPPPDSICTQAFTRWNLSVPVAGLAPGQYSVVVRDASPTPLAVRTFSLLQAVVVPSLTGGATALVAALLALSGSLWLRFSRLS